MSITLQSGSENFNDYEDFLNYCTIEGIVIHSDESIEKFFVNRKENLTRNLLPRTILHYGIRTERMFESILNSFGRALLVEPIPPINSLNKKYKNLSLPDFRVVLEGESFPCVENDYYKKNFLVEVKNYHHDVVLKNFSFKKKYFNGLKKYANLVDTPLKIAIYYSKVNMWVLLSPEAFVETRDGFEVEFLEAMKRNEMSFIGDMMISCEPNLEIRLECAILEEQEKNNTVHYSCKIDQISIYNNNRKIDDLDLLNFAFVLAIFGQWEHRENIYHENNNLIISNIFEPIERSNNGFDSIGYLSGIASNLYKSMSQKGQEIISLPKLDKFPLLPLEKEIKFKDPSFPLWGFRLSPNYQS